MEKQINRQLKELNDQYNRGFFDRPSYQNKRSILIDNFVLTNGGNRTVQMPAEEPDVPRFSADNDILDVADILSVSTQNSIAPSKRDVSKGSEKQNKTFRKRELLLLISGAMMAIAGYLFYLVTSQ